YYTLYYYDQAGSLVKTVPPEGVNLITDPNALAQVKNYRAGNPGSIFTPAVHDMKSIAEYNSLQQIVRTRANEKGLTGSFESGTANIWYDYLGRPVVTQNSRQAAMSPQGYSYVVFDALGRVTESGELQTSAPLTDKDARQSNNYYYFNYNHTVSPTFIESWIAAAPIKREVSYMYYDAPMPGLPADVAALFSGGQQNLRNRVSSVVYDDDPTQTSTLYPGYSAAGQSAYQHAEHYSYDVHGNIVTSVQETPALKTHNQHLKKTTYAYDLISGNVHEVHYQSGEFDQYHYRYTYDANNRLVRSLSSRNGVVYEKDAKNVYPVFSGAGRLELGEKIVQGVDVVSTLHGGIKAMNRAVIGNYGQYAERDLGQDGHAAAANANQNVAADAAGFTLLYWKKDAGTEADYTPVNGSYGSSNYFEADLTGSTFATNITNQYNGNIAAMSTALLGINQTAQEVQGRAFNYDQLYRLKESRAWHMTAGNNNWTAATNDGRYHEKFKYDWNGNITRAERWGNTVVSGQAVKMDDLTYSYQANSNVLEKLTETVAACTYSGDIDNQTAAANYSYDPLGALISDLSERITAMEWNSAGMLKAVRKDQTANIDPCNTAQELGDADVEYLYNVSGQRLCKIVKPHKAGGLGLEPQEKWEYYWYSYESSGIPMAIYKQTYQAQQSAWKVTFEVEEHNLFSSGRIGVRHGDDAGKVWQTFTAAVSSGQFTNLSYTGSNVLPLVTHYERTYGAKQYELSNHLGNVLATVSDKRLPYAALSSAAVVDRYLPDVLSYSDYYAFGAAQPGRTGGEYRYGFNGMEMDKEAKGGVGLSYTTEFRQYDPRVGRWFSPDPIVKVFESPYAAMASNPILYADPSGLDPVERYGFWKRLWNTATGKQYLNNANEVACEKGIDENDISFHERNGDSPAMAIIHLNKNTYTSPSGEIASTEDQIVFHETGMIIYYIQGIDENGFNGLAIIYYKNHASFLLGFDENEGGVIISPPTPAPALTQNQYDDLSSRMYFYSRALQLMISRADFVLELSGKVDAGVQAKLSPKLGLATADLGINLMSVQLLNGRVDFTELGSDNPNAYSGEYIGDGSGALISQKISATLNISERPVAGGEWKHEFRTHGEGSSFNDVYDYGVYGIVPIFKKKNEPQGDNKTLDDMGLLSSPNIKPAQIGKDGDFYGINLGGAAALILGFEVNLKIGVKL
ncbi:MAG: RHS repeat-associated core domain-containing protein, partial [Bacteroidota bacterium]